MGGHGTGGESAADESSSPAGLTRHSQWSATRVASGGHAIAEEVVRRRYAAGLRHLLGVYRPLVTTWAVYDNSGLVPRLVAAGERSATSVVVDPETWSRMREQAGADA